MDGPSLAGLADAHERLREAVGEDISFWTPTVATWPDGTVLDPQTGEPYDPTIEPESGGDLQETVIRCNVAHRPVSGLNDNTADEPVGDIELGRIVLITGVESLEAVEAATEFDAKGDRHKITQVKTDGIGGDYRVLVWGERMRATDD